MANEYREDELQETLLESAIGMLDSPDGSSHGPSIDAYKDPEYADFDLDLLLTPVVTPDPALTVTGFGGGTLELSTEVDGMDVDLHHGTDVGELEQPGDGFFADLSALDADDMVLKRPPLTSIEMPNALIDVSEADLSSFDDLTMLQGTPPSLPDPSVDSFFDAPENDIEPELENVSAVIAEDTGSAIDLMRDFADDNVAPDIGLAGEEPPYVGDDFFSIAPGLDMQTDPVAEMNAQQDIRDGQEESFPDIASIIEIPETKSSPSHAGNANQKLEQEQTPEAGADNFDLDAALGGISSHIPDADVYHQKLDQTELDMKQVDPSLDSSVFLRNNGSDDERKEPVMLASGATEFKKEDPSLGGTVITERLTSEPGSKLPIVMFAASVLIASVLSVASTWWWTTKSASAQTARMEMEAVKSDLALMNSHLNTMKSMTQSGDGITLLSAYENLSKKQQQLSQEQANLLTMLKTQSDASTQFESEMINRLEQVVNYTKSVSDRQVLSESTLRSELAQTVVMEVSAKTAGIDRLKIEQMSSELAQAKQRMSQMEKDVKTQTALVSLLEGETEYVRAQIKRQSEQRPAPAASTSNVTVRATPRETSALSTENNSFSSAISDYVVIGVLNSGDNGFEIFLQSKEAVNSSSFETYYFKPGEPTQVPGYGNILNVQDTGSDDYAVPYQVVTEKGVIRGRKR